MNEALRDTEVLLSRSDRSAIWLQMGIARLTAPLTAAAVIAWMRLARGYRLRDVLQIRREFAQRLAEPGAGPVVVCANHLTLIDSFLIAWALSPPWRAALQTRHYPWNLPEKRNFYTNLAKRLLCYLGKCIPVVRQGPREETQRLLERVKWLLDRRQTLMIFPEGTRSRDGRVDTENFAYGVGTILQRSPTARVACIYLRGNTQKGFSDFPARKDEFRPQFLWLEPDWSAPGLRGARAISTRIVKTLAELEIEYFSWESAAAQPVANSELKNPIDLASVQAPVETALPQELNHRATHSTAAAGSALAAGE